MKPTMFVVVLVALGVPAYAQINLGGALKKGLETKQSVDQLNISDEDERKIGEVVSLKIRQRFGVVQDANVHKYVALVGTTIAKTSDRPNLDWTFVVLDTDGVNAFASPGGLVHITRGALGLVHNEAELAGVLAHEIGHVTRKHAINAIRKNKAVQLGSKEALGDKGQLLDQLANRAYEIVLENSFNRDDEMDADKVSVELTQKVGYAPGSLGDFLTRLDDRNKDTPTKNGLFASHPDTKERISKVKQMASASKSVAVVEARYKSKITYDAKPITAITAADGSAKPAGSSASTKKTEPEKTEEPKKKGFGLGGLTQTVTPEKEGTQVSSSGGARGIGADRDAKGGSNPNLVKTTVSADELATFKQGIV